MKAVLLASCLLLSVFQSADGFAAWLVDRELGCWTYLTEGEVIMNHEIVAATNSRHPDIHLQVFREGQMVEPDQSTLTVPFSSKGETIQVRLFMPKELEHLDAQFVVETTKGAKFTAPYVGCEGKRSAGKKKTAEMTLTLTGEEETVELVAGWASGHEAVTLTQKLILKRDDAQIDSAPGELKEETETVKAGQAAIENLHVEHGAVNTEEQGEIGKEATEHISDSKNDAIGRTSNHESQKKQLIEALDEQRAIYMEDNRLDPSERRERKEKKRKMAEVEHQRMKGSRGFFSRLQHMQNKYDSDDFGSSTFSMRNFAYACVFSLVFIVGVVQYAAKAPHGEEKDL